MSEHHQSTEDEEKKTKPPIPLHGILSWWVGDADTSKDIVVGLILHFGGIVFVLVVATLFGGNGINVLTACLVVGVWIFVWRKRR